MIKEIRHHCASSDVSSYLLREADMVANIFAKPKIDKHSHFGPPLQFYVFIPSSIIYCYMSFIALVEHSSFNTTTTIAKKNQFNLNDAYHWTHIFK